MGCPESFSNKHNFVFIAAPNAEHFALGDGEQIISSERRNILLLHRNVSSHFIAVQWGEESSEDVQWGEDVTCWSHKEGD